MDLKILKTEDDYNKALERVDYLMDLDPKEETKENDELELLVLLIEKYEELHWKIDTPDPIEAIKFRMEQMGLQQKDIIPYIGSKGKVSEVLNRKKNLSLAMIKKLYSGLHIPLEVLINDDKRVAS